VHGLPVVEHVGEGVILSVFDRDFARDLFLADLALYLDGSEAWDVGIFPNFTGIAGEVFVRTSFHI
jgi:hypothetical protein